MNDDPIWLVLARQDIGLREIKGAQTAPKIAQWLQDLGAWWRDDETPWCGTACAAWLKKCSIEPPKNWYRAKAWADWGVRLENPVVGCIVVFERTGGGHVGLVVGETPDGRLLVLGGNQGDAVGIAPFDRSRVIAYRYPAGYKNLRMGLPVLLSTAASSTNEA